MHKKGSTPLLILTKIAELYAFSESTLPLQRVNVEIFHCSKFIPIHVTIF